MSGHALITGASSGIGSEFARQLAAKGVNLVLASRNLEKLEALAAELESCSGIQAVAVKADLSVPGSAAKLIDECDRQNITIDILINNAGMGMFGESTSQDAERIEGLLTLNVTSLTTLSSILGSRRGMGRALSRRGTRGTKGRHGIPQPPPRGGDAHIFGLPASLVYPSGVFSIRPALSRWPAARNLERNAAGD